MGFILLMVLWWGLTYCAPNSLELVQPFYAPGADLTTVPAREQRTTFRFSGAEPLFRLIVLVFHTRHQLVPNFVPNFFLFSFFLFSPVPLRNVSWGLGVCSVFVRSVSQRRLVLEVRSFPSPPALFRPVARRLCPLSSSSCLSGLTRLRPGVCVCNI